MEMIFGSLCQDNIANGCVSSEICGAVIGKHGLKQVSGHCVWKLVQNHSARTNY